MCRRSPYRRASRRRGRFRSAQASARAPSSRSRDPFGTPAPSACSRLREVEPAERVQLPAECQALRLRGRKRLGEAVAPRHPPSTSPAPHASIAAPRNTTRRPDPTGRDQDRSATYRHRSSPLPPDSSVSRSAPLAATSSGCLICARVAIRMLQTSSDLHLAIAGVARRPLRRRSWRRRRASTTCDPMKPAPPVTMMLCLVMLREGLP